jgi:hypothetical protein
MLRVMQSFASAATHTANGGVQYPIATDTGEAEAVAIDEQLKRSHTASPSEAERPESAAGPALGTSTWNSQRASPVSGIRW